MRIVVDNDPKLEDGLKKKEGEKIISLREQVRAASPKRSPEQPPPTPQTPVAQKESVKDQKDKQTVKAQVYHPTQRRLRKGWIQSYLDYTEGQESPSKFHFFAALSVLAGVARRHIFLNRGYYILYPNIYVILVAGSAICRKSTACNIAMNFIFELELKHVFHGKITSEGLLEFMSQIKPHHVQGKPVVDTSPFIYSDELHVLFSGQTYTEQLTKIFTDFYGGKKQWDYKTKNSGTASIRNASPTILAASTPIWLAKAFPPELIHAGLTGRSFFVYESRGKRIAHPEMPPKKLHQDLMHDLSHISNLTGEFRWTEDAHDAFRTWYETLDYGSESDVLESYYARKPDHALKLAMLLSINESDDLVINLKYWNHALRVLSEVESNTRYAFQYMGTPEAALAGELLAVVRAMDGVELVNEAYSRVAHKFRGSTQFEEVITSLSMQKKLERRRMLTNGEEILFIPNHKDVKKQGAKFARLQKHPRRGLKKDLSERDFPVKGKGE